MSILRNFKKQIFPWVALLFIALPQSANAQWRIGAVAGADYNHYSIDKHYMTDLQYKGRWGLNLGLSGQYDVNDWLGVRADVMWTQKNHRQYRTQVSSDYNTTNNYLQLPVMASFSFGGEKLRGFFNVGVYGGYWLSSHEKGTMFNVMSEIQTYQFSEKVEFNKDRDQRWDCGLVGGAGVEYRFSSRWAAQVEARCYYSTTSTQKDYMSYRDPHYNTTVALQATVYYTLGKTSK